MADAPRPFAEWHEDHGNVLWWRLPVSEPPYCGTPLDLGRGFRVTFEIGVEDAVEMTGNTGGWPFTEEDEPHLWWTPLAIPTFPGPATGDALEPPPLSELHASAGAGHAPGSAAADGSRASLPRFSAPEPRTSELIPHWHYRVIKEFERWVNEDLAPALAAGERV